MINHENERRQQVLGQISTMMSRRNILAAGGTSAMIAMVGSASLAQPAATEASPDLRTTSDT